MFVQIDGKNVTITNETYYAAGTVAVYKCISDSHSLLVNATGGSREHSRTCDTVSANWTGAIPTKCGQSNNNIGFDFDWPYVRWHSKLIPQEPETIIYYYLYYIIHVLMF